jgi:hypothetical protein
MDRRRHHQHRAQSQRPALFATLLGVAASVGCSTTPYGFVDNWAGRRSTAELCHGMRTFTRAPLDEAGLRRAWFLPLGSGADGIDMYAPMTAQPFDAAANSFYGARAAQLTHYRTPPEFAAALASCLTERYGYNRSSHSMTNTTFRASFTDQSFGRSVTIVATDGTTRILIADKSWNGNPNDALEHGTVLEP